MWRFEFWQGRKNHVRPRISNVTYLSLMTESRGVRLQVSNLIKLPMLRGGGEDQPRTTRCSSHRRKGMLKPKNVSWTPKLALQPSMCSIAIQRYA